MMDRIRCGGLIEKSGLCLVEILGYGWQPGEACGILSLFAQAGCSLSFLNVGNSSDGRRNMAICLDRDYLLQAQQVVEEIETQLSPRKAVITEAVTMLTLYGPHFHEKHGLASSAYAAFCSAAINTLAVCSSVNSISFVIAAADSKQTHECLRGSFDWPE